MAISMGASAFRDRVLVKELLFETSAAMYFSKMGQISVLEDGKQTILLRKKNLTVQKGHYIKIGFSPFLTDDPIIGDDEAEGNEEDMEAYSQDVYINQARKPVILKGNMDEKRIAYNMRMQAKTSIKNYMSRYVEKDAFRKASGTVAETFANTPTTPTSGRHLYGGNATSTSDIDSSDKTSLEGISKCKVLAKTEVSGTPIMPPLDLPNGVKYVMFIHEYQAHDIKRDPEWNVNQREAQVRGIKNPLFQDAIGQHDGVLLVPHPFITTYSTWGSGGVTPGARALLFGAHALLVAEGAPAKWVEKSKDYDNKWAICSGIIFGIQKTKFNSKDYSILAYDTYAINPNA